MCLYVLLFFFVLMSAVSFGLRSAGLSSESDHLVYMLSAMVCLVVSLVSARKIAAKLPVKDKSKWWWKL